MDLGVGNILQVPASGGTNPLDEAPHLAQFRLACRIMVEKFVG
jgi:hypothetical protein